jgi:hypothetical protein
VNSGLDRFVTIRSIVAQGRPGHPEKGGAKSLPVPSLNVRGRDTSAPDFIRSIQAVYLKRDGAVSVVQGCRS